MQKSGSEWKKSGPSENVTEWKIVWVKKWTAWISGPSEKVDQVKKLAQSKRGADLKNEEEWKSWLSEKVGWVKNWSWVKKWAEWKCWLGEKVGWAKKWAGWKSGFEYKKMGPDQTRPDNKIPMICPTERKWAKVTFARNVSTFALSTLIWSRTASDRQSLKQKPQETFTPLQTPFMIQVYLNRWGGASQNSDSPTFFYYNNINVSPRI